jgi:adenylylsulfate kinase
VILVFCGPPGVGKTAVAECLQHRLAAAGLEFRVLRSDDFSRDTYRRMYERVSDAVAGGETDLILDGTFYRREWQDRFRALPDAHLVSVTAGLETALARNRERTDPIDERGVRVLHAQFEEPKRPDLTLNTEVLSVGDAADAVGRYVLTWRTGV